MNQEDSNLSTITQSTAKSTLMESKTA